MYKHIPALTRTLIVIAVTLSSTSVLAWNVYNDTSRNISVLIDNVEGVSGTHTGCGNWTNGDGQVVKAGSSTRGADGADPASPNYSNKDCNPTQKQTATMDFYILGRSGLLTNDLSDGKGYSMCRVAGTAGGYVKVLEQDRTGFSTFTDPGPNIYCLSFDHNNNLIESSDPFAQSETPANMRTKNRDIVFLATGDPQYRDGKAGYQETSDNTLRAMRNRLRDEPNLRGALIAGDITQHAMENELGWYKDIICCREHKFLEGLGNHDVKRNQNRPNDTNPDLIKAYVNEKARNTGLTKRATNGDYDIAHYSWEWHDIHFIQANLYPGNNPQNTEGDPDEALNFIKEDLDRYVGSSGRPVVITHHYGFDPFSEQSWEPWQRKNYWEAIRNYNVIAILTGHSHLDSGVAYAAWDDYPFVRVENDGWKERKDRRQHIPTFNVAAARGSDAGCEDSACNNGVYTEISMDDCNVMTLKQKDHNGAKLNEATIRFETDNIWGWYRPTDCSMPEPSFLHTSQKATARTDTIIDVTWVDSAANDGNGGSIDEYAYDDTSTLETLATGYLVQCWTGASPHQIPVDGTTYPDDADCSDGQGVQHIEYQQEIASWTGLAKSTEYKFRIYPYNDSGTTIEYKSDTDPGKFNGTTLDDYGLTIRVDTQPNDSLAHVFTLIATGGAAPLLVGVYTLDDDPTDLTYENTLNLNFLDAGSYQLIRGNTSNTDYTYDLNCNDPDNGSEIPDASGDNIIDLDNGENIICTATAKRNVGSITIKKVVTGSTYSSRAFTYTLDGSTSFSVSELDVSGYELTDLPVGDHDIIEFVPIGWNSPTVSCTNNGSGLPNNNNAITNGVRVTLEPQETTTCTFTTTPPPSGNIIIKTEVYPDNDPQDFTFDAAALTPSSFTLDDDSGDSTFLESQSFREVPTGFYTVTGPLVSGFDLTSINCEDPDGGTATVSESAFIDLDQGETIVCTWEYTGVGNITLLQDTQPDDAQEFTFTSSSDGDVLNLFSGTLTLDDDPSDSTWPNSVTYSNVIAGEYQVAQDLVSGYSLDNFYCVDINSSEDVNFQELTIRLEPGEDIFCAFQNSEAEPDTDGDGVPDDIDNCISIPNPYQEPSAINPACGLACVTSGCAGPLCVNH